MGELNESQQPIGGAIRVPKSENRAEFETRARGVADDERWLGLLLAS